MGTRFCSNYDRSRKLDGPVDKEVGCKTFVPVTTAFQLLSVNRHQRSKNQVGMQCKHWTLCLFLMTSHYGKMQMSHGKYYYICQTRSNPYYLLNMCVYVCNCDYVTICSKLNIQMYVIWVFMHVSYMEIMKREIEEERGLETSVGQERRRKEDTNWYCFTK